MRTVPQVPTKFCLFKGHFLLSNSLQHPICTNWFLSIVTNHELYSQARATVSQTRSRRRNNRTIVAPTGLAVSEYRLCTVQKVTSLAQPRAANLSLAGCREQVRRAVNGVTRLAPALLPITKKHGYLWVATMIWRPTFTNKTQ